MLETEIAAPVERCFLLSLSLDLHRESAAATGEQAVAGVTSGIIGEGQEVTWRGRHFGFWLQHHTRISAYDRPRYFQDSMVKGMFRSFAHDHFFTPTATGTTMRDELRFAAPLGPLGWLAERLFLRAHLQRFLLQRNAVIAQVATGPEQGWRRFLG